MNKPITVLSLFDGMSCGRIALDRAGINVKKYYAFEIDKPAIQIARKNSPDTIHLGDVTNWWWHKIDRPDLVIAGSPCQGFSFAGKQLNFEDPRSKLFFELVDILKHFKPKYFLLENVVMKKEYQQVITGTLGVEPVKINSALVSAQNRNRLYWYNWECKPPADKGIPLGMVLGPRLPEYNITKRVKAKRPGTLAYEKAHKQTRGIWDKSNCLLTRGQTISNSGATNILLDEEYWKPTPVECERLQTVPDNYTEGVSRAQRYKMLGNGWTVDVIAHILRGIK